MGFLSELKKLAHPYDEDDDDFFGSASDDQPEEEQNTAAATERRSSFFSTPDEAAPESVGIPSGPKNRPAFRIPKRELRRQADAADAAEASARTRRAAPAQGKPQMSMASPVKFEESARLADELLDGHTILLNLEKAGKVDARRMLDFMSGVAYAIQGYVKRVSGSIYLVVPNGGDVAEGDAMNQMENNGVYF